MKIFLDTASVKEIREGAALGLVDGGHAQGGKGVHDLLRRAPDVADDDVH